MDGGAAGQAVAVIAVIAAAAFFVVKAVRLFRGDKPSCCNGGPHCPHCKRTASRKTTD